MVSPIFPEGAITEGGLCVCVCAIAVHTRPNRIWYRMVHANALASCVTHFSGHQQLVYMEPNSDRCGSKMSIQDLLLLLLLLLLIPSLQHTSFPTYLSYEQVRLTSWKEWSYYLIRVIRPLYTHTQSIVQTTTTPTSTLKLLTAQPHI